MNEVDNPFAPGAGTQPPELAGREAVIEAVEVQLGRAMKGRAAKSLLILGLRGVGKTVLLNRIAESAEELEMRIVMVEAPEDRTLAELLVPSLRRILFQLSNTEAAKELALRGLGVLRSFASAFSVSAGGLEFKVEAESGSADTGNLELDLPEVLLAAAKAAKAAGSGVAILIDEVQYLSKEDLSALIVSLHKIAQKGLPLVFVGAGLPQLAGLAGEAKSYAERLFDYPEVGPLRRDDAQEALAVPIEREGEEITEEALQSLVERTQGYPYFIQEWGYQVWNVAIGSPIGVEDVEQASELALGRLDAGFFRVRLDRLTPREKDYVRAMASLGAGPHRSGDVAEAMGLRVTQAAPIRSGLIRKGMIYSPQHGDTAFTVPMFDEFMLRSMPDWSPG